MKILFLPLMFILTLFQNTQKEYVCLPCGYDCDKEVYSTAGVCKHCGMKLVDKASIKFKTVSIDDMCARLKANPNAVLLDVRSPEEFKGTSTEVPSFGHFKNAININVTELESRVKELNQYKDKEVLVYCSHSHRSPRASYFLSTNGFSNVTNMADGVSKITSTPSDCLKKNYVVHAH